jgi:hypothetical protein
MVEWFGTSEWGKVFADGLLVQPFVAPGWSGAGRLVLKRGEALVPEVHVSEGALAIDWRAADGRTLVRQTVKAKVEGAEVLLTERAEALDELVLEVNEGFGFLVPNDLRNKGRRAVRDQRGKEHVVRAGSGKPLLLRPGHIVLVEGRLKIEADQEMAYVGTPSLGPGQADRITVPGGKGAFATGDVVRAGMVRLATM